MKSVLITGTSKGIGFETALSFARGGYKVFATMKTKCVGCLLQRFCSLRDVAETYQIPLQELTGELEK